MSTALVDGHRQETISVYDEGLLRGDGCFEAIRLYDGAVFAFTPHYQWLTRSAAALDIPCPPESELRAWVDELAREGNDCIVRVVLTRGSGDRLPGRCIVLWQPLLPKVERLRLLPVAAPWHPGGERWELTGVKTISYAPNMAAGRLARCQGFDDALLISTEGFVLEGPTFGILWIRRDGLIETPALNLGILDSVTVRLLLAALAADGQRVVSGRFRLEDVEQANEVVAVSTVKEVAPVVAIGQLSYSPAAFTNYLSGRHQGMIEENKRVRT